MTPKSIWPLDENNQDKELRALSLTGRHYPHQMASQDKMVLSDNTNCDVLYKCILYTSVKFRFNQNKPCGI